MWNQPAAFSARACPAGRPAIRNSSNGLLSVRKRFPVATLTVEDPRPDSVRVCLARLVAEHLVKLESLPHVLIGRVMTVEAAVGARRDSIWMIA